MKALDILKKWPVDLVSDTPATHAFNAKLVTRADLLRLKVIARLHARGLPPDVGWSDLLQEAFARVLDGSRAQPEEVPIVAFLSGVMRSIKEQHWRRARKGARRNSRLLAEFDAAPGADGEIPDPAPNPERSVIALQEMDAIHQLFADDPAARQIIAGLYEGWTPEEICATYAMSKTDYDSTRRRIRRALVRAGLRFVQP